AEHAAARAAVHEIPAAREHRNLSSHLAYLDRASRFVNARLTCGASALWHPVERLLRVGVVLHRLFGCHARLGVCVKLPTPRRNLVIPTNLAVIGPWFPPPVRVGHRGGGSANVFHRQPLARRRRASYPLRPAQSLVLRPAPGAAVACRRADPGGTLAPPPPAAAHDAPRLPAAPA